MNSVSTVIVHVLVPKSIIRALKAINVFHRYLPKINTEYSTVKLYFAPL